MEEALEELSGRHPTSEKLLEEAPAVQLAQDLQVGQCSLWVALAQFQQLAGVEHTVHGLWVNSQAG